MESSLNLGSLAALFGAMVVLAVVPGVSVLVVSARSAAYGFRHGVYTTLGLAAGDVFFVLLAILGLAFLADRLGELFVLIKYAGGVYLLWFGVKLWRAQSGARALEQGDAREVSRFSSFLTGALITLGDQKVIFFYFAFFPAFLDLSALSYVDALVVLAIDLLALMGAKLAYAYVADRSRAAFSGGRAGRRLNLVAAGVMMATGAVLLFRAWGA